MDKTHLQPMSSIRCIGSRTQYTCTWRHLRDPSDVILKIPFSTFQAASDSLRLMGNRKFYDQLIADMCQHEKDRITDEIDVTTMKDYMQVYGWQVSLFLQSSNLQLWPSLVSDHLTSATSFPKNQKFARQITMFGTSWNINKLPPLISILSNLNFF